MYPKTGGLRNSTGIHREVTFPERHRVAISTMKFAEVPVLPLALTVFTLAFLLMLFV
jgi:hypothetical protein